MGDLDRNLLPSDLPGLEDLSRQFAEYWFSLPKENLVPSRADFQPESIPELLPNVVIHELVRPDLILLRLAGTSVVESYGQEITGKNYLDFVLEGRRAKASEAIFNICEQPCGMVVQLISTTRKGALLNRESIAFPIRDHDRVARFVYFCSSSTERRRYSGEERDELLVMTVPERTYFDIGAGIPDFSE